MADTQSPAGLDACIQCSKKGCNIDAVIPTIKQMNSAALLQDPACTSQNDMVMIITQDLIAF